MNEITNEKKIEVLETIIKAIFGRQSADKIEYRQSCEDLIEVKIECDLDDTVKILHNLSIADIDFDFYDFVRKIPEKDVSNIFPEPYESVVEITLMLSTDYYKKSKNLEEENKQLKEQLNLYLLQNIKKDGKIE